MDKGAYDTCFFLLFFWAYGTCSATHDRMSFLFSAQLLKVGFWYQPVFRGGVWATMLLRCPTTEPRTHPNAMSVQFKPKPRITCQLNIPAVFVAATATCTVLFSGNCYPSCMFSPLTPSTVSLIIITLMAYSMVSLLRRVASLSYSEFFLY